MRSVIERKLVVDVFTDKDYAMLAKTARINPRPYVPEFSTFIPPQLLYHGIITRIELP